MNSHRFSYILILAATLSVGLWLPTTLQTAQAAKAENNRLRPAAATPAVAENSLISEPLNSDAGKFNSLEAIRHSASGSKVRLVLNTQAEPVFDYSFSNQGKSLIIDLINTRQSNVKPEGAPKSKAIKSWQVSWPDLNRSRFTINFASALQTDKVSFFKLKEPHRLVVDIDTTPKPLPSTYKISPGITWSRQLIKDPTFGTLLWNQLLFDRSDPHVSVDVALANNNNPHTVAVLSKIVPQEEGAVAGINGGFFNMPNGGLLGLVVKDGKLISPHVGRRPARSVIAFTKDGQPFIDRLKAIKGQVVRLNGQPTPPLRMALGAGPTLLKNGQLYITADAEELGPKGNDITRACGRSLIAYNKDQMMLATLSGARDSHSQGWKLPVLAKYLQKKGMTEALNLDGGGSVGMAIGPNIVGNGPQAGTYQRPIGDDLVLKDSRGTAYPSLIKIDLPKTLKSDGRDKGQASVLALNSKGNPVPDGTVLELYGLGLSCPSQVVTKDGRAEFEVHSLRSPGTANLTACGLFSKGTANMRLESGEPHKLIVQLSDCVRRTTALSASSSQTSTLAQPTACPPTSQTLAQAQPDEDNLEAPIPEQPLKGLIDLGEAETSEPSETSPASPVPSLRVQEATTPASSKLALTLKVLVEDEWHNALPLSPFSVEDAQGQVLYQGQTDRRGAACLNLETAADNARIFIKSPKLKTLTLELGEQPHFAK